MTEEEIRPIAENYVEEYCHCSDGEYTDGSLVCAGIGTALIVSRQLEKRIAELEKQHDIVRNERNLFQERCEDILENYYCDHKCKCADLEKENAELKKELVEKGQHLDLTEREWAKDMSKMIHYKTQSTKAKELLKGIVDTPMYNQIGGEMYENEEYKDLITEAEQFLKEN